MVHHQPKFYRVRNKPLKQRYVTANPIRVDTAQALRENFVCQLKLSGQYEPEVLSAMAKVPRHLFVDEALTNHAYTDTVLPIGFQQTVSKPSLVARMISLLLQSDSAKQRRFCSKILEIGTGCGYQTALLSHLASEVCSIERIHPLYLQAKNCLAQLAYQNIQTLHEDGMNGWPEPTLFEGIILSACGHEVPVKLLEQLALGGRLVMPLEVNKQEQCLLIVDKSIRGLRYEHLDLVNFVPLISGTC